MQLLLRHSLAALQVAPCIFRETQIFPLQYAVLLHIASTVHTDTQAAPLGPRTQLEGAQLVDADTPQIPVPLQVEDLFSVIPSAAHEGELHIVPDG
jgi:hypothetical protein